MARFYGNIGFEITEETRPGIDTEEYIERPYKGEVLRHSKRWDTGEQLNDNFSVAQDISIVADNFANSHFGIMRYVRWMDQVFEITSASIDTERHRITLTLGGIFNVPDSD